MKKLLVLFSISLILFGCSKAETGLTEDESNSKIESEGYVEQVYYDYTNEFELNDDNTVTTVTQGDAIYDVNDPLDLRANSDVVFIGTIISKDYATCSPIEGEYSPIPYTSGSIEVIQSLKGDITGSIEFYRSGGIVTVNEFLRNAPKERVEKIKSLSQGNENYTYIKSYMLGDIDIESGKSYLFYAKHHKDTDRYFIIGYEGGTREIISENTKNLYSLDNTNLKNNVTGEYEDLQNYIDVYLK